MSAMTPHQQQAVEASGNVLVVAGAGAGKTSTLVQRCLHFILAHDTPVSIDEILMVTFTDAAAAEMRQRIREELMKRLEAAPDNQRLEEQLALLDAADICTLHSFCLRLVRQHFHDLSLDPQIKVLSSEESGQIAADTLNELLKQHYRGEDEPALAVQRLIQEQAGGWDKKIRELVLQIFHYTQTLPDPDAWLTQQSAALSQAQPTQWRAWLEASFDEWRGTWVALLGEQPVENENAKHCARVLRELPGAASREARAQVLQEILERGGDACWPHGTKGKFRVPIEELFTEAAFLHSLMAIKDGIDPLAEDWDWVRPHLLTLLRLVRDFTAQYSAAKRELAGVDFHDLEQMALTLLLGPQRDAPTPLAQHWAARLKLVFVDEYQDINAAQDAILAALSRKDATANRFLVGDVKQSIYRFRLANPRIFQAYDRQWRNSGEGRVIPLADNFRSHEGLLNFINPFFEACMRPEMGGVTYDEEASLRFGNREGRIALTVTQDPQPRVEVHLCLTGKKHPGEGEEDAAKAEVTKAEREAGVIGSRLRALLETSHPVWDKKLGALRPVKWSDMVILLRSVKSRAESYAKVFHRLGIPLQAARTGFYECVEVSDVLSVLTLIDNPLQDVPLLAVLRSPFVGLTVNELAEIRLAGRKMYFWQALQRWHEARHPGTAPADSKLFQKVDTFLQRHRRWRHLARNASLSQQVEAILAETLYLDWLAGQPRGEELTANVQQLLALARQFDQFQQQGLYRFLKLVETEQAAESGREPASTEVENAVRLTSIHQSKGLEYPVVVLADLGKRFNLADAQGSILLDEEFGLCAMVKPPHTGQRYPSLPVWLARKRQRRESLGEELRLLYVALTRARDTLLLVGSISETTVLEKWPGSASQNPPLRQLLRAGSFLDWLGPWLCHLIKTPSWAEHDTGESDGIRWAIYRNALELLPAAASEDASANGGDNISEATLTALKLRLNWEYSFNAATLEPAKTSVSAWRRRWMEEAEARPLFRLPSARRKLKQRLYAAGQSAADIGMAHHAFFQYVEPDLTGSLEELRDEATRMVDAGLLQPEDVAGLDFAAMLDFWHSNLGKRIRQSPDQVQREMPFTARLAVNDFFAVAGRPPKISDAEVAALSREFMVVQGQVDLAIIAPREIVVVDFKTDSIDAEELAARTQFHAPQLRLYATVLENIYQRPVKGLWLHFLSLHRSVEVGRNTP